ncbi:MAG TPA: hypothetical protein VH165_37305, partial [Kofleriaceae bacterium]|nr:hypothetical protein [Kofleriaceae bacterium]
KAARFTPAARRVYYQGTFPSLFRGTAAKFTPAARRVYYQGTFPSPLPRHSREIHPRRASPRAVLIVLRGSDGIGAVNA